MQNIFSRKNIFLFIVFLFALHLILRIVSYSGEYLSRYDAKYWEGRYLRSQWVVSNSKESIGDDGLYAYAGWEYIHGRDPTTLNAELPPLGKYLIGLSTLVFGNQNIFALLTGVFVLFGYFLLNKQIFKDNYLSFLPVFLFSLGPLFYTQLRAPFLDLLYLGFLIMTFYFFLKERFILAALFLGMMMATKSSVSTFFIVSVTMFLALLYMKHTDQIKRYVLSLLVSIGVFIATYSVYFFNDHSFFSFLGVQKWVLTFYAVGAKGDLSAPLQMILIGKWPTWWGETLQVTEWNIFWPVAFFASIYYLYTVLWKRKKFPSSLLGIWVVIYFIFLMLIPAWPRYLLLLLPFMYTLFVWVLLKSKLFKSGS